MNINFANFQETTAFSAALGETASFGVLDRFKKDINQLFNPGDVAVFSFQSRFYGTMLELYVEYKRALFTDTKNKNRVLIFNAMGMAHADIVSELNFLSTYKENKAILVLLIRNEGTLNLSPLGDTKPIPSAKVTPIRLNTSNGKLERE